MYHLLSVCIKGGYATAYHVQIKDRNGLIIAEENNMMCCCTPRCFYSLPLNGSISNYQVYISSIIGGVAGESTGYFLTEGEF